jgi:glutathione S-transferase
MFLALLLVAGAPFPVTAAISGAVYSLGKLAYFMGYSTGDPNKRLWGSFSYFGLLALIGCVGRFSFQLLSM